MIFRSHAFCYVQVFLTPFPLQVNVFPITIMFGMCSIFLFMAAILQWRLMVVSDTQRASKLALVPFSIMWFCTLLHATKSPCCLIMKYKSLEILPSTVVGSSCRTTRLDCYEGNERWRPATEYISAQWSIFTLQFCVLPMQALRKESDVHKQNYWELRISSYNLILEMRVWSESGLWSSNVSVVSAGEWSNVGG